MGSSADQDVLQAKADVVEEAFGVLDDIEREGRERFLEDDRSYYAARTALLEATEAALDAANHVIAAEGFRRAEDYADLVTVLEEEGIVEADLAERIRAMARFRNLLVHRYGALERERVWRILTKDRQDIGAFVGRLFEAFVDG